MLSSHVNNWLEISVNVPMSDHYREPCIQKFLLKLLISNKLWINSGFFQCFSDKLFKRSIKLFLAEILTVTTTGQSSFITFATRMERPF